MLILSVSFFLLTGARTLTLWLALALLTRAPQAPWASSPASCLCTLSMAPSRLT